MALGDQPTTLVLNPQVQSANGTVIVVKCARGNRDALTQHLLLERSKRLHAGWLPNFRSICALEPYFQRLLANGGFNPQRIAVHHPRNHARLCLPRSCCRLESQKNDQDICYSFCS